MIKFMKIGLIVILVYAGWFTRGLLADKDMASLEQSLSKAYETKLKTEVTAKDAAIEELLNKITSLNDSNERIAIDNDRLHNEADTANRRLSEGTTCTAERKKLREGNNLLKECGSLLKEGNSLLRNTSLNHDTLIDLLILNKKDN